MSTQHALNESYWTAPSDECLHPEWYTSADPFSTENEVCDLVYGLIRAIQPEIVLETGTFRGVMMCKMFNALCANGHGHLITFEHNTQFLESLSSVIQNLRDQCTINRSDIHGAVTVQLIDKNSLEYPLDSFLHQFTSKIQFAWFDTELNIRQSEFVRFYPYLNGMVGFHDTSAKHSVVMHQVNFLEGIGLIKPIRFKTPRGVVIAEVIPGKDIENWNIEPAF